jgi:hypothetical protein
MFRGDGWTGLAVGIKISGKKKYLESYMQDNWGDKNLCYGELGLGIREAWNSV